MILVDSSVWIQLFGKKPKIQLKDDQLALLATCPPVVQEVLQGVADDLAHRKLRESFLALPLLSAPVPLDVYLKASDIYRQGRRRGLTIRSSMDCLIAAIAMAHQVPVWHADRDFDKIAQFTELEIFSGF